MTTNPNINTARLSLGHYNTLFHEAITKLDLPPQPEYQGKPLAALALTIATNPIISMNSMLNRTYGTSLEHLTVTPMGSFHDSSYIGGSRIIHGKPFTDFRLSYARENFKGIHNHDTTARTLENTKSLSVLGLNAAALAQRAYEDLHVHRGKHNLLYMVDIIKNPNVPLNGNESQEWLEAFADHMRNRKLELFEEWASSREDPLTHLEIDTPEADILHSLKKHIKAQNQARAFLADTAK